MKGAALVVAVGLVFGPAMLNTVKSSLIRQTEVAHLQIVYVHGVVLRDVVDVCTR